MECRKDKLKMAQKILTTELRCQHCNRWFSLTDKQIKLTPYQVVPCKRCGLDNSTLSPGTYDKPGTPKAKCRRQYVVLAASKPTVKVKTKKFIIKPYTTTHKGRRFSFQVRYNLDGTLPWQPVKIGTRWYMLRASGIAKQPHRTEVACQRSVDLSVALYSSLMM